MPTNRLTRFAEFFVETVEGLGAVGANEDCTTLAELGTTNEGEEWLLDLVDVAARLGQMHSHETIAVASTSLQEVLRLMLRVSAGRPGLPRWP